MAARRPGEPVRREPVVSPEEELKKLVESINKTITEMNKQLEAAVKKLEEEIRKMQATRPG
ncbi:MAG: hypothetical protein QW794_00010 [Thermosphaera sp.]